MKRIVKGHSHRGRTRIVCDIDPDEFDRIKAARLPGCTSMAEKNPPLTRMGAGRLGLRQVTPSDDAHRAQIAALSGLLAGIPIGFAIGLVVALIFT
jgi:hypothetical protein